MKTRKIKEKMKKGTHILIKFKIKKGTHDFKDYISKANDMTEKKKEISEKKLNQRKSEVSLFPIYKPSFKSFTLLWNIQV
jgi:hypothetical protein